MLSWQMGDVRLTQVVELTTASLGPYLLPQTTPEAMQPIFDAGQAMIVPQHHQVTAEVSLQPTLGHVSVHIQSNSEASSITNDTIHHSCQTAHPHWSTVGDTDLSAAADTRAEFLQRYGDQPVLVIGTHFAVPTAGHIVKDGDAYRLSY